MATAKGTKQLNVGISTPLMEALQEFVNKRGEKLRAVVEQALRRHLQNPPPIVEPPPLPPVTAPKPDPAMAQVVSQIKGAEEGIAARKKKPRGKK